MAHIETYAVASGWQWTAYIGGDRFSADEIRGGWASTPAAAKKRAENVLAAAEGE